MPVLVAPSCICHMAQTPYPSSGKCTAYRPGHRLWLTHSSHTQLFWLFALPVLLQLLGSVPAGALLACFEADAAAFQAKQPKLPKKGQRNILVRCSVHE